MHNVLTSRDGGDGEFKVRGRAVASEDPAVQLRYADAVAANLGWHPEPGRFHLWAIDIDDVTVIRYDDTTGDQYVARWPAGREFVRRGHVGDLGGRARAASGAAHRRVITLPVTSAAASETR